MVNLLKVPHHGRIPLHMAIENVMGLDFLEHLIDAWPEAVQMVDQDVCAIMGHHAPRDTMGHKEPPWTTMEHFGTPLTTSP